MQPGDILDGRFRIDEPLGAGGMGAVYRAWHLELDEPVAVKVIHGQLQENEEWRGRFRREARLARALRHPNAVGVYDFGQTDDGLLYLAMEYVEGETLDDLLKRNPEGLPLEEVVRLVTQVASALDEMHREEGQKKRIVHRDLKPTNVIVRADGAAKVVDFGIARGAGEATITDPGFMTGTPAYLSPEQIKGEAPDGGSDQYSLGLIAYELITGSPAFSSETVTGYIYQHLNAMPFPMHERRDGISQASGEVINRMVAKRSDERFPTAGAAANALACALGIEGAQAIVDAPRPVGASTLVRAIARAHTGASLFIRRHKRQVAFSALAAVPLLALALFGGLPEGPSADPAGEALQELLTPGRLAVYTEPSAAALRDSLAHVDWLEFVSDENSAAAFIRQEGERFAVWAGGEEVVPLRSDYERRLAVGREPEQSPGYVGTASALCGPLRRAYSLAGLSRLHRSSPGLSVTLALLPAGVTPQPELLRTQVDTAFVGERYTLWATVRVEEEDSGEDEVFLSVAVGGLTSEPFVFRPGGAERGVPLSAEQLNRPIPLYPRAFEISPVTGSESLKAWAGNVDFDFQSFIDALPGCEGTPPRGRGMGLDTWGLDADGRLATRKWATDERRVEFVSR